MERIPPIESFLQGAPEAQTSTSRRILRALMEPAAGAHSHLDWAWGYPGRAFNRLQGLEPDGGQGTDVTSIMMPNSPYGMLDGIAAQRPGRYQPGQRESTNIIDRRPTSTWDYR